MPLPTVSVAVFAYNEEARIVACLDALRACADEARLLVHVLINGCTDGTERKVLGYAESASTAPGIEVRPVVLARGDKANAWNHYTHEVAPAEAAMHVFTDGDMAIGRGSIAGFLSTFAAEPDAMGCAGLPATGRSRDAFRDKLLRGREMAGNLYALRGECLREFRRRGIRLPFGLFGEDGLVTTLVKWNLDPRAELDDRRVTACEAATFTFEPLSPFRPRDLRIYRNRKMRYAVRQWQAEMLYPLLRERGVEAMPAHVLDLYRERDKALALRWNGLDTWFDWVARRRILDDLAASDRARHADRAHLYS